MIIAIYHGMGVYKTFTTMVFIALLGLRVCVMMQMQNKSEYKA
jgi:hypothetical protein